MHVSPVPVPRSRADRFLATLGWLRHPGDTRELARVTDGFRASGVVRRYANDIAGRRTEAREGAILWHRGYRPPTRITHDAMWRTGGPTIAIGYSRELVPGFMSERSRAIAERLGLSRR